MTRKNRVKKSLEYEEKYGHIPVNYDDRLNWMYDTLNINETKSIEIINKRDMMISSLYYKTINVVLYEEPEGSPRPRARLINRANLSNMALQNQNFIHIYSLTGNEDRIYMNRLVNQEDFIELDNLICTPCDIVYKTFSKTPSSFSKSDIFLAEIGLHRPTAKPDWDNLGKKYSDMSTYNIWLDDIFVVDGMVRKFYSILPRIEIQISYLNMIYNKYQYNSIINRKDYKPEYNLQYFNGGIK